MIIYYDLVLLKCFSSWDRVWCSPGQPSTSYVAHDDFDILILKPWPPVCWGDRCVPPSSVYVLQRMKPKVLRLLDKQSIKWVISSAIFEGFGQQLCFSYHSLSIPISEIFSTVEIFFQLPTAWWSCTFWIEVAF